MCVSCVPLPGWAEGVGIPILLSVKNGPLRDPPNAPSSALSEVTRSRIALRLELREFCNSQAPHSAVAGTWPVLQILLEGSWKSPGAAPPGPEGAGFRNSFMHRPYRRVHAPNQMPELRSPVSPSVSASISPNCANLVLTGFSSACPPSPSKNSWWLAWCIARFPLDADRKATLKLWPLTGSARARANFRGRRNQNPMWRVAIEAGIEAAEALGSPRSSRLGCLVPVVVFGLIIHYTHGMRL